jgi:hypothetical protein
VLELMSQRVDLKVQGDPTDYGGLGAIFFRDPVHSGVPISLAFWNSPSTPEGAGQSQRRVDGSALASTHLVPWLSRQVDEIRSDHLTVRWPSPMSSPAANGSTGAACRR